MKKYMNKIAILVILILCACVLCACTENAATSIDISCSEGGTVELARYYNIMGNSVIGLTAVPTEGYTFVCWFVNGEFFGDEIEVSFVSEKKDYVIYAVFNKILDYEFQLKVGSTPGGSVNNVGGMYKEGTVVELVATATNGYRFVGWYTSGTHSLLSEETSYSCTTLFCETRITAVFIQADLFYVDICATEGGFVDELLENGFKEGATIKITAYAEKGYKFIGWYIDGVLIDYNVNLEYTVVNHDVRIVAKFVLDDGVVYTFDVDCTDGGTANIAHEEYTVGQKVVLVAQPADDYVFIGWYENGQELSVEYEFTYVMQARNTVINCVFGVPEESYRMVSVRMITDWEESDRGGKVSFTDESFAIGDKVVVEAQAYDGYYFIGWYLGGIRFIRSSRYEFTMNDKDIELFAVFVSENSVHKYN
ncbi:MAG: InlB B-repeat-containing protein [Clostridia bacterium]|nr:InlB B-repeat-containing protein [Clostridia bacterium]